MKKVILDPVEPDKNRRGSMSDPIQKRPKRFQTLPYGNPYEWPRALSL